MTEKKYIIREIEERDDSAVEGVIRACLIEYGGNREGTAWCDPDLCRFSQVYCDETNKYWVAEDCEGKIIGGVGIGGKGFPDGVCELQKMYCLPEARGLGLGLCLMDTAINYARKYYKVCFLETLENMTRAQRFYEKYGFQRTEERVAETEHFACGVRYLLRF